ncbi:MAG TPA: hypothetical protein VMA71_02195 [Alloacidobacterium sp.]|nr:hypothetical protein [Alloacidobacterium sp.]
MYPELDTCFFIMHVLALILALLVPASSGQDSAHKAIPSKQSAIQEPGFIFWKMSRHSVDLLLDPVPQSNTLRFAQLKQTLTDLQCQRDHLHEQAFSEGLNLLCTLPATALSKQYESQPGTNATGEAGIILFLANYAHEGSGQSAIEDWSGAIMLPFLYHGLVAAPRYHTFLFAEVDGEAGARALFDSLTPAQRRALRGVVALDSLGLGPAEFYSNPNDTNGLRVIDTTNVTQACEWFPLCRALMHAAGDLRVDAPVYAIPGAWFRTDVTREFRHHGVPCIVIHSVTFSTRDLPGSLRDTAQAIDHDRYFDTLTLLDDYAAELDQPWMTPSSIAPSSPSRGRRR